MPLYESSLETVKSEIATFLEVFPNGTVWGNETAFEEGYDVVLLGQTGAARFDVDELQRRLERPDRALVSKSLRELGFGSALHLLAPLRGAQINRDRNLRLQYLAGMGINSQGAIFIYDEMLRYFGDRLHNLETHLTRRRLISRLCSLSPKFGAR